MTNDVEAFLRRSSQSKASYEAEERWRSENLTFTSLAGAGKSCVIKALKGLGTFDCASGGDFMRDEAARQRKVIDVLMAENARDPERKLDTACDKHLYEFMRRNGKRKAVDSRISQCFDPFAMHVYLFCPRAIRAYRRYRDFLKEYHREPKLIKFVHFGGVLCDMFRRDNGDIARLSRLYPDSIWPITDFDLVIPTHIFNQEQVVDLVLAKHEQWLKGKFQPLEFQEEWRMAA